MGKQITVLKLAKCSHDKYLDKKNVQKPTMIHGVAAQSTEPDVLIYTSNYMAWNAITD